jgi:copper chaperone
MQANDRPTHPSTTLAITGMSCGSCRRHVSAALEQIEGVEQVDVDLATRSASVRHSSAVSSAALIAAITQAGYGARVTGAAARSGVS